MKHSWLATTSFAHRGLHGPVSGHVENSVSAFDAALQKGYGFELDVLLSKDEKAIVFHDQNLLRLTGIDAELCQLSAKEITKIKLSGSNDNIPTLGDTLTSVGHKASILVEIKGAQNKYKEIALAVLKGLKNHNGEIAVMSFYPEIISHFKSSDENVVRGLVATSINDGKMPNEFFDLKYQINVIQKLNVDFIAYDIRALPNQVTEYCRENDIPVLTWTVRSDGDRERASKYTDNIIFEMS